MNRCLPTFCIRPRPLFNSTGELFSAAVICGLAAGFVVSTATAQVAPPTSANPPVVPTAAPAPKPPSNIEKTSATPNVSALVAFIKEDVSRLIGDDTDAASIARADLVTGSMSPSPISPSNVVYLDAYIGALSRELAGSLAKNPSLRVKVNIGVVAAKVAENAKAILPAVSLQGVIQTLMQDPNDAVALWGMKGAAAILTAPNQAVPNAALLRLILPTVEAHKYSGPITNEAYLGLKDLNPQVIDTLLKLYTRRVAIYKTGSVPQDPAIENLASSELTTQAGMWSKLSDQDHRKVMNLIADVLSEASKAMGKPENADKVDQLRIVIIKSLAAVYVVAEDQGLKDQAQRATKMGSNTPATTVVQIVDPIVDAVRKAFPVTAAAGNVVPSSAKP